MWLVTFLFAGMRRLWVYTKVKPGRQLLLQLSRSSDCISQIMSIFVVSVCRLPVGVRIYSYCTSNPLPTVAPGVRTPVLTAGRQRLPLGEREHAFGGAGCQSLLKGKLQLTYNQMPSRPQLFLWASDKYSWPPWPGNLYSSAVYDQGQPTLIFNTISCGLLTIKGDYQVS